MFWHKNRSQKCGLAPDKMPTYFTHPPTSPKKIKNKTIKHPQVCCHPFTGQILFIKMWLWLCSIIFIIRWDLTVCWVGNRLETSLAESSKPALLISLFKLRVGNVDSFTSSPSRIMKKLELASLLDSVRTKHKSAPFIPMFNCWFCLSASQHAKFTWQGGAVLLLHFLTACVRRPTTYRSRFFADLIRSDRNDGWSHRNGTRVVRHKKIWTRGRFICRFWSFYLSHNRHTDNSASSSSSCRKKLISEHRLFLSNFHFHH